MKSPSRPSPLALGALAAIGALTTSLLTGCDLGHPGGFTARSNSYCAQTSTEIAKLTHPTTPKAQLQFATDRYTIIERLVSEMTDSTLPSGSAGSTLRADWLRPARTSLVSGRTVLADLRAAVNADRPDPADVQFALSLAIGTEDVDTTLLRAKGLTDCADLFTPTTI
jgi:hypothetical protein